MIAIEFINHLDNRVVSQELEGIINVPENTYIVAIYKDGVPQCVAPHVLITNKEVADIANWNKYGSQTDFYGTERNIDPTTLLLTPKFCFNGTTSPQQPDPEPDPEEEEEEAPEGLGVLLQNRDTNVPLGGALLKVSYGEQVYFVNAGLDGRVQLPPIFPEMTLGGVNLDVSETTVPYYPVEITYESYNSNLNAITFPPLTF